jgi:hypothetical protein
MEGGDRKDAALAKEVGAIAKRVAEIIGQKATHEGSEALDLSDADDFDMKYYMEDEMEKVVNNGADQDSDPIVAVLGELLAKAGREPSRVQRMQMARGNIRKARDETRDAEKCLKAAHAALRKAYFAKMAKAGKKDDDDDDDADEMAMKAIVAGFAKLSSVRTMLKAANGQLKKAASGRSGQRGQEVGDGEGRFYTVPPGVKDLSPNDLATAGPGSDARGSAPPIQSLEHEWKSAKADSRVKNAAARGYISTETAEALARAAAAEAKVEVLEKLPAVPSGGRRPALFDLSKLAPDAADQAGLMKGVDPTALTSTDENVRQKALGTVIGNMILGGQGKSVFSPDFRGGAGI